jgi:1-acyl-sn-glycerol-3-phosphate acyltransferase
MDPAAALRAGGNDAVAIVGIACRFPGGADGPAEFWRLLEQGFDAIAEPPQSRAAFLDAFDPDPKTPGRTYTRRGGFLDRIDLFDAPFFGISPREAVHIDPQHRLLLELAWEACEDAGISAHGLAGSDAGVFVGISTHDYGDIQMYPAHRRDIDMHTNIGTATSIAANRISYALDLRGPSVAIDTACSSSLSAVHFACQSLRAGECHVAFVGGAQILLSPELTIGFAKASMLSREGACRAFDAGASGYVRSEGAGVVILKPLATALDDGDPIWAVIRATAVNQDGRTPGMTVPSPAAQQAMIDRALRGARMTPLDVHYVEAHGTGTPVGDPIEARAISAALVRGRTNGDLLAIGSVKTNLGHLEAASGIAGLIKVALALRYRRIPPSIHFDRSNDAIDLPALGLRVVTELECWPSQSLPAGAGVNSFGFGGANAHVVLQEPPAVPVPELSDEERPRILVVSARSDRALNELASSCAAYLREDAAPPMRDVCHTAAERRAHHDHRLAVVAKNRIECASLLTDFTTGAMRAGVSNNRVSPGGPPRIAFVFSGMGPQWWGMGRQLRASEPVFRRSLERCDSVLRDYVSWSLLDELAADESQSRVAAAEIAHVTNFAIQLALTELWASFGIVPHAVMGHSGGATTASCVAGVHSLEDALFLAVHRSRLQGRPSNTGKMLAVGAPVEEIGALLKGSESIVSLAAVNAPASITLAGDGAALERIAAGLLERQIFARFLPVTIAYHSPAMDGIKDEFLGIARQIRGRAGTLPFVSDTTGGRFDGSKCDANYWWRAIREPVLFSDGIHELVELGATDFVEVGPHPVLSPSIRECLRARAHGGQVLPSLNRQEDERVLMLRSLGALYTAGCMPNWRSLRESGARAVKLPRYPWQRERHWFEPTSTGDGDVHVNKAGAGDHPLLGPRLRAARPTWECRAGAGSTAYLRDHVVQGAPLWPGAAYVEQAAAARTALDDPPAIVVRDLEFLKPLRVSGDGGTPVQFSMDQSDGRFEIFAMPSGESQNWVCHARGSVTAARNLATRRVDLEAARQRCTNAASVDDFYERMAQRGLQYGPIFRGVRRLWTGRREALGAISVDGLQVDGGYRLHPALLDGAFQVLVAAADSDPTADGSRLFLPTKVSEVRLHANPGPRFDVIASVTGLSDSEVVGNLQIVGADGQACVEILGLTARLFDSPEHDHGGATDQWLYEYRWERDDGATASAGVRFASLTRACLSVGSFPMGLGIEDFNRQAADQSRDTRWVDYDEVVEDLLDEIAAAWVFEAFTRLGHRFESGVPLEPIAATATDTWRTLLQRQLYALLERAGHARRSGTHWKATGTGPRASAERLSCELLQAFPRHELDVALMNRCGPRIADVLAGHAGGRDILFGDDGFALLERFYRESPASTFYNGLAAQVLADLTAGGSTRPVRVLEVGAGTGGTTSHVIPRLAGASRYVFTDASPLFLERARAKFRDVQNWSGQLFDMTQDPLAQGLAQDSFDVVFAANALHAVPDVESAMRRLTSLIAPGGALVLLEITRHPAWLDIVFGLMDDWWTVRDRSRRPTHPLMPGDAWRRVMGECGLESIAIVSDATTYEPAQSIVIGRRPRVEPSTTRSRLDGPEWAIVEDERRGVGRRLAAALELRGARVRIVARSDDPVATADSLRSAQGLAGLIYLPGIDTPELHDDEAFAEGLELGCSGVLQILQSIVHGSPLAEGTLFLATAGAQVVETGRDRGPDLLQAPLWGFGRVVRKEWPALSCRLVDFSAGVSDDELSSFADEVLSSGEPRDAGTYEEELAFRGANRFVHRLRPTSRSRLADSAPTSIPSPEDGWRAEIATVGALDSIAFRTCDRSPPRPHEVEVRIEAASLNFRDVVVAMGAVAGLERELTFGQRRLGFDFAGVVTRCGEGVTHVKPGDPVFGIAQSAFASYAIADAVLVVPRQPPLTAVEASTVPVAFVTAWYGLRKLASLRSGESVLIHAASGGVGFAAMQMAKLAGARIFATAGSQAKRDFVGSFGAEAVMDSRSLTFADEIRERTGGRGVDVVLNSLPGEALERGLEALAPYGRFVELGKADIYQNQRVGLGPFRKNLSLFAVDLDRMCFERTAAVGDLLREVAHEFEEGRLRPPPCTEFAMSQLADALRFMAQAKHMGKVVVKNDERVRVRRAIPATPPIRRDGSYLITGGLGGLGLRVARWLVDRGAGAIVLMSRHAPTLEAEATITELRLGGSSVEVVRGDVASTADVARAISLTRTTLPPLRGIVHAAMVLEDRPLGDLDRAAFDRVMAPKAFGAWRLHAATASDDLDFFVSFSSITAILGNPQQANYAAANAFVDALAEYRRARGLPATSINWGVVTGAGYVARHPEIEEYLKRHGYLAFTPEQTLGLLSELIRYDAGHVIAARIDWRQFADYAPGAAASSQLRHLVPAVDGAVAPTVEGLRAALERDDAVARVDRVEGYLRDQVARLLGAAPAAIDISRPITDFGLDSLIAVELTVILERDLGIQISGTQILAGTSVRTLAEHVLSAMSLDGRRVAPGPSQDLEPDDEIRAAVTAEAPVAVSAAVPPTAVVALTADQPNAADPGASSSVNDSGGIDYRSLDYSRWSPSQRVIKRLTAIGFGMLGRIDVQGLEHLPTSGPCLLVVNHVSMADVPLMLSLLPRRAIILAVDELTRFPVLDWFVSDMGQAIYVTRNQLDEEPMRRALTVLESGGLLALAPEGRRNREGLGHGRTGAAYLAMRARVPIVPLVAWGQERWRHRWKSLARIPISVRAGEAFRLPNVPVSPPDLVRYTADIMHHLAALLPPDYRGVYRDREGASIAPSLAVPAETTGWTSRF